MTPPQQLACAQCVAEFKGNMQQKYPTGFPDQQAAQQFMTDHPLQQGVTMANGTLICMDHVQVGSTAAQMLLAPLSRG